MHHGAKGYYHYQKYDQYQEFEEGGRKYEIMFKQVPQDYLTSHWSFWISPLGLRSYKILLIDSVYGYNLSNFAVSVMPADDLALLRARAFAGTGTNN